MQTGYDSLHQTSEVDSQCHCSKDGKNAIYIVKLHLWKDERDLIHLTAHLIGQICLNKSHKPN